MSKRIHLCVDIRGLLNNTRFPSGYRNLIANDDAEMLSPHAAREALYDHLAQGHKVLPTCDCEGFSYQTGCPGHEEPEVECIGGVPTEDKSPIEIDFDKVPF